MYYTLSEKEVQPINRVFEIKSEELFTDRYTVIKDGKKVGTYPTFEIAFKIAYLKFGGLGFEIKEIK